MQGLEQGGSIDDRRNGKKKKRRDKREGESEIREDERGEARRTTFTLT
jgi:hypothetical protein